MLKKIMLSLVALSVIGFGNGNFAEAMMPLDSAVQYIKTNAGEAKILNRDNGNKEFLFFENSSHDGLKSFRFHYNAQEPEKSVSALEFRNKNMMVGTPSTWPRAIVFACKDGAKVPVDVYKRIYGVEGKSLSGLRGYAVFSKEELYDIAKHGGVEHSYLVYNNPKDMVNAQLVHEGENHATNISNFNAAIAHCLKVLEAEQDKAAIEDNLAQEAKLVAAQVQAIAKDEQDPRYPIKHLTELSEKLKKTPVYTICGNNKRYGRIMFETWRDVSNKKDSLYSVKDVYTCYYWESANLLYGYNGLIFELQDDSRIGLSTTGTVINNAQRYSPASHGMFSYTEGYVEFPPTLISNILQHGGIKNIYTIGKQGLVSLIADKPEKLAKGTKLLNDWLKFMQETYGLDGEWYAFQKQKEARQMENPKVYNKAFGIYFCDK